MPTLTTSIEKTAAAIGVPNRAVKAATSAHDHNVFIFFIKTEKPAKCTADTAPNRKAAPSRPAEPPNKWVITVEIKIKGAMRSGISSFEWIAERTRLVPVSFSSF